MSNKSNAKVYLGPGTDAKLSGLAAVFIAKEYRGTGLTDAIFDGES